MPLRIYVVHAALFKSPLEDGTTKLKNRPAFYGVSFIYANSPEAKGKIGRLHQVWQDRRPPFFAKNGVPPDLGGGNGGIARLVSWRNGHETHSETGMTARAKTNPANSHSPVLKTTLPITYIKVILISIPVRSAGGGLTSGTVIATNPPCEAKGILI